MLLSHTVGLEHLRNDLDLLFKTFTSPSHTVGLERCAWEEEGDDIRCKVTIPHGGLGTMWREKFKLIASKVAIPRGGLRTHQCVASGEG